MSASYVMMAGNARCHSPSSAPSSARAALARSIQRPSNPAHVIASCMIALCRFPLSLAVDIDFKPRRIHSCDFVAMLNLAANTTPTTYEADVAPQFRLLVSNAIYAGRLARMQTAAGDNLSESMTRAAAASPCGECLATFMEAYADEPRVATALNAVVTGL